jgi:hypothetical protein
VGACTADHMAAGITHVRLAPSLLGRHRSVESVSVDSTWSWPPGAARAPPRRAWSPCGPPGPVGGRWAAPRRCGLRARGCGCKGRDTRRRIGMVVHEFEGGVDAGAADQACVRGGDACVMAEAKSASRQPSHRRFTAVHTRARRVSGACCLVRGGRGLGACGPVPTVHRCCCLVLGRGGGSRTRAYPISARVPTASMSRDGQSPGCRGVEAVEPLSRRCRGLCRGLSRYLSRLTPCGCGVEVSRFVSRLSRCRGVEAVEALHSVEAYAHP